MKIPFAFVTENVRNVINLAEMMTLTTNERRKFGAFFSPVIQ